MDPWQSGRSWIHSQSHLKRSDKKGLNWMIPDEHEKLNVYDDQILARNINVVIMACLCHIKLVKLPPKTSQTIEQFNRDCL